MGKYDILVKDAEFNPTGKQGVYSGFQGWADRAGRFTFCRIDAVADRHRMVLAHHLAEVPRS